MHRGKLKWGAAAATDLYRVRSTLCEPYFLVFSSAMLSLAMSASIGVLWSYFSRNQATRARGGTVVNPLPPPRIYIVTTS